ncbi:MAG: peptidoglycan DD-metalloendopeptidase family protein [Clostridiales bacterium]|nr:peptidoglycan DD-metalloendopeptidase family protein [Clostridiales bacterium]
MKRSIAFFWLLFISGFVSIHSGQILSLRSSLGPEVGFASGSFAPGGLVVVQLRGAEAVKKAVIRFSGETYELGPADEGLEPFVLVGLDLGLNPGTHVFDVIIQARNGQTEVLKQEFMLQPREFPVRKLWVREEYVTPPAEVQERIKWEAELLRTIWSIVTPQWLAEGEFILPHHGEMAPNFGERRIYNNVPRSPHSGVDISAPAGDPVRASNTGRVVLARDLYFSGKTVILDHGLGVFTYYCHFSRIKAKRGEVVKKGEVIGQAGSTGRSTGPHLHWSVRIRESRVDPVALLNLSLRE